MWYGWTGNELEVDLSQKKTKKRQGDRKLYEDYLGGYGLVTKLFWDRVPPETEPFSPDNLLIFGAGPLVGTTAPAACRTCLATRSIRTDYLTISNMAGFWGPELKFAGYDTLIVSGKSDTPVYIYINNDKVEIRDASHLWGKDVYQTQQMLREELKDDKVQTLCIGPAGENRVYWASIEHGTGCSLSRNGGGAVMGDKKLKAIAVRGNKNVNIARPGPFLEFCDKIMSQSAFIEAGESARWPDAVNGTLYLNTLKSKKRLYRNFEFMKGWKEGQKDYLSFLQERAALMVSCFNCQQSCIHAMHLPDGESVYWKCHSRHIFIAAADVHDFGFALRCFALVQKYGLDTDSASNLCRFAIDLYQKGILTKEDTGGLALEWSNPEVIPALLEKVARREGLGDILANGVYEAAQQIGKGAEEYTHHFRKLEIGQGGTADFGGITGAVRTLASDRQGADVLTHGAWYFGELLQGLKDPNEVERWKKYLAASRDETDIDGEILGKRLAYEADNAVLRDCSGLCYARFGKDDGLMPHGTAFWLEPMVYATGMELDEEKANEIAHRIRALIRAYNSILGERMRVDDLDSRSLPQSSQDQAILNQKLAETNRVMGFSPEGIPTKEKLEELGLDDVARELDRRGILPEPAAIPG